MGRLPGGLRWECWSDGKLFTTGDTEEHGENRSLQPSGCQMRPGRRTDEGVRAYTVRGGEHPKRCWNASTLQDSSISTDFQLVEQFGPRLDSRANDETLRDLLIRKLLRIRVKKGGIHFLKLNRAQQEYSRKCSQRNIVLKARQVGITTYIAAQFFYSDDYATWNADGSGHA